MNEPATEPMEPVTEPPEPAGEPSARPARHVLPWLTGAGFLVLAAGLAWVWVHPFAPSVPSEPIEALAGRLAALEQRVTRLEQRPQPQPQDLAPLAARIVALERRGTAVPDLAPLEARVAALEQRQPSNSAELDTRVAALENAGRTAQAELTHRLEAMESRFAAGEQAMRRVPLVQKAALALAAGQKLGALPGAPAALAQFADAAPPTEASLRLAFPQAARDALAASYPVTEGKPLLARLWARAQDLITIRQGDRVLIGDPAAGVLERARAALDAGDIATAVAELQTLQGGAAQAMAGWLAQARALLDARAALAQWAASD